MSYTPGFAPDAQSQWLALEARFQEMVLDELDRLALSPPSELEYISDVVHEESGQRHYVFVHVLVNPQGQTLERARQLGASEAEILTSYPALRAEDLVNAWSYARAHQADIERQIRENEEP